MFRKFIGDKKFYFMVMTITLPIIVQNAITNFVSLLDNIMVGQVGTEQMSGVAIVNQLMFVYSLCIFGAVSGAGIFGAQFFGSGDYEGFRNAFRFKLISCILVLLLGAVIFVTLGTPLINLYLHEGSDAADITATLFYAKKYLWIMLIGLAPFTLSQVYSSTLRETGETFVPMVGGITAVITNTCLNYILIFGKFGLPALGVEGAAIATVFSRFFEAGIIIIWTHTHEKKVPFIQHIYKTLKIPGKLAWQILIKGMPLLVNEALWAGGMAVMTQCYSIRGLAVVAGTNISSTISNVFNIAFVALGTSLSIIVGQLLGAGKMEEAKDTDRKLIFFSVVCCLFLGAVLFFTAPFFPSIYKTTDEVKSLATHFIRVSAVCMPMYAFLHSCYFTLRSGGKTLITFLFDSVFVWTVSIPTAFVLTRFSPWSIVPIFAVCQGVEIIKCIVGYILVKKGVWLNNIVAHD